MLNSMRWRMALTCGFLALGASLAVGVLLLSRVDGAASPGGSALPEAYVLLLLNASIVASIVSAGLAYAVGVSSALPLRRLTKIARSMANGNLDQPVPISGPEEVRELSAAFSQTAIRLRDIVSTLSAERNTMGAMLERLDDGIVITDHSGKVLLVNPSAERMLRISGARAVGKSFMGVVRDHELQDVLRRCLETREQQSAQVELGPGKRYLQVLASPVEVGQGHAGLVFLQDLTQVRRADVVRREFISNVSHELRTPLASLKLLVETLQEGAIEDHAAARQFLDRMNVEVDGMAQLVRELLELSRIESGRVPLNLAPISVEPVLRHAAERLRPQAERGGLELEIAVSPDLLPILADEDRVDQVLMNLIHNAIKFTPSGGTISIRAEAVNGEVAISVADTGVGVPPDDLARIFERFYKADKARSSGGTGLGLAIAKHLIQAHGGAIRAENNASGGATFTITLPTVASE